MLRPCLPLLLFVLAVTPLPAQDVLATLQQQVDQAVKEVNQQKDKTAAAQKALQDHQQNLAQLARTLAETRKVPTDNVEKLKKAEEEVKKAQAAFDPTQKPLEEARQALETAKGTDKEADATKKVTEAEQKFNDAKAALDKTRAEVKALQDATAAAEKNAPELEKQIEAGKQQTEPLQAELTKQQAELARLETAAVGVRRQHEAELIKAGQLVSFTHGVAPILAKRCIACHNARTAKGRLNLENYAALMKGGESGDAVDPGKGDLSNLFVRVEDNSMPEGADPLSDEEKALIKKWIDTGARLDAGVDDKAPLITIIPKPPHPAPPESYRVAIPVTALVFSPDGKMLASSGYHEVFLWNAENGELIRRISDVAERVYDLQFSPDGQTLAVAAGTPAQMGEVRLIKVADGTLIRDLQTTEDSVFAVAFNPDGTRLATAGADRSIRVYEVATGERQLLIEDHADWVMGIAWSPDGTKLASASRDKTSKIFDSKTGDSLVTFNGHGNIVYDVAFLADNTQVITCGSDKQLRVWNAGDGKQVRNTGGFGDEVLDLQITPSNEVISASADKNVRLHQATSGQALKTFSGHKDWVYSAAIHPASKRAASGSFDGEIQVWNLDDAKSVLTFTAIPRKQTASK